MNYRLKFFQGQQNVEMIRAKIDDPENLNVLKNENNNLDPEKIDKIELVVGDVVISSESGEITWNSDIFYIKPSVEHLAELTRRSFSELVVYKNGESATIANGYVYIANI